MAEKQKRLGRGLDVLFKDEATVTKQSTLQKKTTKETDGALKEVAIGKIVTSPWQPRKFFDAESLTELVQSIQTHGVLQPLLVRSVGGKFELIAGERRLRAARSALLKKVPIIIVDATDEKAMEIALIENLQREDLNPIEEAEGYAVLQKKFKFTQEQVAKQVGKARASIANSLRLLDLPECIQKYLSDGLLSMGHAKVLLALGIETEQELLARRAIKEGLSVRALERLVKKLTQPPKKPRAQKNDLPSEYLHTLTDELHQFFGTSVRLVPSKTLTNGRKMKGSLEIDFHDNDELDRLLSLVGYSTDL